MAQNDKLIGYYSSYKAGRYAGDSEDRIMFTCYSPDMWPGQCSLVLAHDAPSHRMALERNGYRLAFPTYWDLVTQDSVLRPEIADQMSFVSDASDYIARFWTKPHFYIAETLEAAKSKIYVRDVCVRCGRTIERECKQS